MTSLRLSLSKLPTRKRCSSVSSECWKIVAAGFEHDQPPLEVDRQVGSVLHLRYACTISVRPSPSKSPASTSCWTSQLCSVAAGLLQLKPPAAVKWQVGSEAQPRQYWTMSRRPSL